MLTTVVVSLVIGVGMQLKGSYRTQLSHMLSEGGPVVAHVVALAMGMLGYTAFSPCNLGFYAMPPTHRMLSAAFFEMKQVCV